MKIFFINYEKKNQKLLTMNLPDDNILHVNRKRKQKILKLVYYYTARF